MGIANEEMEEQYFLDVLHFLHETQWLYNTPVTEILTAEILDKFPEDWLAALEKLEYNDLNEFVVKKTIKPEWPSTLKAFVEKCVNTNRLPVMKPFLALNLPRNFTTGLGHKKQHEIIHLAQLVHDQCKNCKVDVIIDFGAGLVRNKNQNYEIKMF